MALIPEKFDLKQKLADFLNDPKKKVMLITAESGGGKTKCL